jgi:3-hydroxybutyrate dehydrogenase
LKNGIFRTQLNTEINVRHDRFQLPEFHKLFKLRVMSSKVILITGAESGLGRGLAEYFGSKKLHVIATGLNIDTLSECAETIRKAGGSAEPFALDVTREADVAALVKSLPEQRIDVLVNNAGMQHVAPLEEFPADKWSLLIDIMLKGACWTTRAVLPGMKARNFGRIVNIGSIHSLVASPYKTAYTAAKHGLVGFSKSVALETADRDITINTICPSYIFTPLVEAQIKSQAKVHHISEADVIEKIMLKPMPKKAFISIEEVAATVEFLISSHARNISGQTITLDGGWTAQ